VIGITLGIFAKLVEHYEKKWRHDRINQHYDSWIESEQMRKDYGFDEKTIQRIPRRKIRNNASRKKHGY
jgi:hypothetical protein